MSKYIEDVQGKIESNPINETNTKYGYVEQRNADSYAINTQYMYTEKPVSDIDTGVYDDYRNTIENLRTKTESYNEALESCLIPVEIPGMSFRPYEFINSEDDYGKIIKEKVESFTYFFQDHMSPISATAKEYVFRTNKVKFIDDKTRRLNYDRQIHLMTLKDDEENRVSFKDVILRTFFIYEGSHISRVKNEYGNDLSYDSIITAIYNDIINNKYKYTVIDSGGNEKQFSSKSDFDLTFKSGQDINTLIPSSLYNLHNIGWVNPSVIFVNGLIIPWTKVILSVDNIDTFVIITGLGDIVNKIIDECSEVFLDYVHIPFKVEYIVDSISSSTPYYKKYVTSGKLNKDVIFVTDKTNCAVKFNYIDSDKYNNADLGSSAIDRIICIDPNIKYTEFPIGENNTPINDIGIEHCKSLRSFCDNDYRCKLKRFNFLGFELSRYWDEDNTKGTFKNDDFNTEWHPFNIIDIKFNRIYNHRRVMKVFYNTKVLYDQDNVLRIKNKDKLSVEFERFRRDNTANIAIYMNELYAMIKRDLGVYTATKGKLNGYNYTFVSPYECYLIYNAISKLRNQSQVNIDGFRKITVDGGNYLNGGFIAVRNEQSNPFLEMVKESDVFEADGSVKAEVSNCLKTAINSGISTEDILLPIESTVFTKFEGDTRGKVVPYIKKQNLYGIKQKFVDTLYDKLKVRFELTYLNNVEEGATPVDEFIYYFDNKSTVNFDTYPVVDTNNLDNRKTADIFNALATNIFALDPDTILPTIKKLNYCADFILPINLGDVNREDFIVTADKESYTNISGYDYRLDPHSYYNFGYRDAKDVPHRVSNEWSLRRNLPEMFSWSLDDKYTLSSMNLLEEVFDFSYDPTKTYEENLKEGTNYIIGYDADKLEQSIKRSVVSVSKTGKELKQIMSSKPCTTFCSVIDGYKVITFVSNKDQKVFFDNLFITVTINSSSITSITCKDREGNSVSFNTVSFKYKSQDNYTVRKTSNSITYIDKSFTVSYDRTNYNKATQLLEFYSGNTLVVTMQIDKLIDTSRLQMSRWNINKHENYVMIFKNRQLYEKYSTIEYTDLAFSVDGTDIEDSDVFEFVFFLNANNTVMKKIYNSFDDESLTIPEIYYTVGGKTTVDKMITLDRAIACNTDIIEPENVQLLVNVMPVSDGICETDDTENTTYELSCNIKSYDATSQATSIGPRINYILSDDTKVNGLNRITKLGGGEYYITYTGEVPKNTYEDIFGDYNTNRLLNKPFNLYITSKRQFRYKVFVADEDISAGSVYLLNKSEYTEPFNSYKYKTGLDDFKFCLHNSHILVFKNGLLLPRNLYYIHSLPANPVKDTGIMFNVDIASGDRIEIFYVTNDLKHMDTEYYDLEKKIKYIENGEIKIANNKETPYLVMGDTFIPDNYILLNTVNKGDIEYRIMRENVTENVAKIKVYNDDSEYDLLPNIIIKPSRVELKTNSNKFMANGYNTTDRSNYIKFHCPLYGMTSKNSVFIFLNGKKVRYDELEDISNTIISINTDYSTQESIINDDMNAVRLEVFNHLDTQDIIENVYINDGLLHIPGIYKIDSEIIKSMTMSDDNTKLEVMNFPLYVYENISSIIFSNTNVEGSEYVVPKVNLKGDLVFDNADPDKPSYTSDDEYEVPNIIFSFSLKDLDNYSKSSKLDIMLDSLSDSKLNSLFYDYYSGRGPMTPYNPDEMNEPDFLSKDDIINSILKKYYDVEELEGFVGYEITGDVIYICNDKFNIVSLELDGFNSSDFQDDTRNSYYVGNNKFNVVDTLLDNMIPIIVDSGGLYVINGVTVIKEKPEPEEDVEDTEEEV